MAWTDADVAALEAKIRTMRKSIFHGDRGVTNFDLKEQLALLKTMKQDAGSSTATRVIKAYMGDDR